MPHPSAVYLSIAALFLPTITNNHNNPPHHLCTAQLLPDEPAHEDYYCGWNWEEANANCEFQCPSGLDGDCPPLPNGRNRRCIAAAGCFVRFEKVYWTGVISLSFDREEHYLANNVAAATTAGSAGFVRIMTEEEVNAFESSFRSHLFEALEEQLRFLAVSTREQEYDRPCVAFVYGGNDPTFTSLDVVVRMVGEYIPIGDKFFTDDQFGERVLALVDADPESFVDAVRNNSPSFFDALSGISAVDEDSVVESPSSMPSEPPSRGFDQVFDMRIDPRASSSYGIVFIVRTPRCGQATSETTCNTILLTGMSFVTSHEGKLEYMIYSKLGPYEKLVGRTYAWDLVASGQTVGKGREQYTRVLEDDTTVWSGSDTTEYVGFQPLHVPGDRGQRSFYVTLTNKFVKDDGSPIQIVFSYPIEDDSEGERTYEVVASTPELEVLEGDGVLEYPWPTDRNGPYYSRPRGFIGSFDYERYPCDSLLNFTGWPCPYVRRTERPTAKPSGRPSAPPATRSPTKNPRNARTAKPTDAQEPVSSSPEAGGVGEENTSDGVVASKKVAFRSCGCGLAILLVYFCH